MRIAHLLILVFVFLGCSAAPAPTPIIIYVTPAPTPIIIYVTPPPTLSTLEPEPPTSTPVASSTLAPTPPPAGEGDGTFEQPFTLGTVFELDDYTVSVVSVDLDAWDEIRRENQFNDPPASGHQYVMFTLAVTYNGSDTGDPFFDMYWDVVGSAGNTFDEYCGVLPDSLSDVNDLYPGASAEGNACVTTPAAQLNGSMLRLETLASSDPVFVSLN